jgi:hypothetical protein
MDAVPCERRMQVERAITRDCNTPSERRKDPEIGRRNVTHGTVPQWGWDTNTCTVDLRILLPRCRGTLEWLSSVRRYSMHRYGARRGHWFPERSNHIHAAGRGGPDACSVLPWQSSKDLR